MPIPCSRLHGRTVGHAWLLVALSLYGAWLAPVGRAGPVGLPATITNCLQARQFGDQNWGLPGSFQMEAQVGWVGPGQKSVALMDSSGGVILELNQSSHPLKPGQRVRLTGRASLRRTGNRFRVGPDALVLNNDGLHQPTERSATVFLKAGPMPLQLDWFNRFAAFSLEVNWEGPDFTRRNLRDAELFRLADDSTNLVQGLNYTCAEGWWTELPDFDALKPVKSGIAHNFDLMFRTRDEGVGLQFAGFLQVPKDGNYTFHVRSDDGSRLQLGTTSLQLEILNPGELPPPRQIVVGQMLEESLDGSWVQVDGKVTQVWSEPDGLHWELSVGPAHLEVAEDQRDQLDAPRLGSLVRATGFCQGAFDPDGLKVPARLLLSDRRNLDIIAAPFATATNQPADAALPPVLATTAEVHQLSREQAQLGRPARLHGVVTSTIPGFNSFTMQDSTGGIFVLGDSPVQIGDFVEVEGVTDPGYFAPILSSGHIRRLGFGRLPEPVRPPWDQLMNGSLEGRYVEVEGIVTAVTEEDMHLLTSGGMMKVSLQYGLPLEDTARYKNKLVRIRGALFAMWDGQTHQVRLGEIQFFNSTIQVEQPAPADISSVPAKTPAELLLFDPRASLFQRIRMSGQIVHLSEDTGYMMVGTNGVRFVTSNPGALHAGDLVEVVGYPQLGGATPLLREAVVTKTGNAALPVARRLPAGGAGSGSYDSTRVILDGMLAGVRQAGTNTVLEMQDEAESFIAHVRGMDKSLASLPAGCRLELTGVYAVHDDRQFSGRPVAFELLISSPADVIVLARPPWWTLQRLLILVGTLAGVLAVTVAWISQLRRVVEERTAQLEDQIQKRQSIEQHRAMEQERARIAKDLHDELGSGLIEIKMLATLPAAGAESSHSLDDIGSRAKQMVMSLDEIVWAMNPKHDSLESLASYLCLYAERFLKPAGITCNFRVSPELPNQALNPVHRHEFFLAFKEALTNVVRHSGATEVRLSLRIIGRRLRLALTDNGQGLPAARLSADMDGLANMRSRLGKMGGRFAIASLTDRGTTVRLYMPLK